MVTVTNARGQLRETFTRGVGLAGDIGTLIAVTHHAGSWTNGTFYTHHNHRGDIVLTRSGTTTVGRYDYSAFGNLKLAIGNDVCRFKFSSKERDPSTGFSYYGYRYYAPAWQRWVSRDPLGDNGSMAYIAAVLEPCHRPPLTSGTAAISEAVDDPLATFILAHVNSYVALGNNLLSNIDPLGLDFGSCYADCIERYRSPLTEKLPNWLINKYLCKGFKVWPYSGAAAYSANALGNVLVGPVDSHAFGTKPHPTTWQHKLGSKFGTYGSRIGKFLGRAAIVVTVLEGFYNIGLLGGCAAACAGE